MKTVKTREGFHGFLTDFPRSIVVACRGAEDSHNEASIGCCTNLLRVFDRVQPTRSRAPRLGASNATEIAPVNFGISGFRIFRQRKARTPESQPSGMRDYTMKIRTSLTALVACGALTGIAHAGPTSPQAVVKKITLTAHIGDSLFVSQPANTAYGVVELSATDGRQPTFATTLPIRVRTTNPDINVTLLQPLRLSNGRDDLANTKVVLTGKAEDAEIAPGVGRTLMLVKPGRDGFDGYDETRNVKVSAQAPAVGGTAPINGHYRGDLVLVFEPAASAGREPTTGAVAAAGE
ncbi:hypothetical protein [Burkholderia cenocepacia]|uniref:hypothetical protein n=1 Tax=Burkholderia cenocepacia TaxID=95486 RepID=UPI001CF500F0|nr:hypothetical protein [Burkholderia cenocepacia]MCA7963499.1 hypothetical protein [Burkholderia cenocepacia]